MIIFDTSGSMLKNDDFDGSPLCNNQGQDSKIYQLKVALFETLQGVGATEADFALATFPMRMDPNRDPKCPEVCRDAPAPNRCAGHYYVTNDQDNEHNGNNACKVSGHDPKDSAHQVANCSTQVCPWYATYKSEVLKVPFGQPPEATMIFFDQKEDHPLVNNPEVRAAPNWYTPLGKSLFYAYGYFDKEVALPSTDYRKKCERLTIAFFTDGAETCNTSTSDFYYATKWAKNLKDDLGVVVNTIAINTSAGIVQQIANSGGGQYFNVQGNAAALKVAFQQIIASSRPPSELCNGADDDCDNQIDEDFPLKGQPCSNGQVGACFRLGTYVCSTSGQAVACNVGLVNGTPEVCNGIDDDCDGEVDEGLTNCLPCAAQPEVCNGKDDDCNGIVDDNLTLGVCGSDVGECKPGTAKCENGKSSCTGGVGPGVEICDGLDNDCDGQRDGFVESCYSFASGCDEKTGACKGQCRLGTRQCSAQLVGGSYKGVWGQCTGDTGPSEEVCDGVDNNCDGEVDEQAECPGGSQCIGGQCSQSCATGEFVCPVGQLCKNGWCVLDPCDHTACAATGGICKAGTCINPCEGVTCNQFSKCDRGVCVDDSCYEAHPCDAGEVCVQGECKKDPCAGVGCGTDEFCSDGTCLKLCDRVSCPDGQLCKLITSGDKKETRCVEDACAGKVCGPGQVCLAGSCVLDPCISAGCTAGQACVDGKCVEDPCEKTDCPSGYKCVAGQCVSAAIGDREVLATGAGGLACSIARVESPIVPWLVLLAALCCLRRRRRDDESR